MHIFTSAVRSEESVETNNTVDFSFLQFQHEVNRVMGSLDNDNKMDIDQFSKLVRSMAPQDEDERIRQTFLAFDTHCKLYNLKIYNQQKK